MPTASDIAHFLHLPLNGEDANIQAFSQLSSPEPHSVVFAKRFRQEYVDALNNVPNILAIVTNDFSGLLSCSHILSDNPRMDFIRTLSQFFAPSRPPGFIHPTAVVEEGATIGKNVFVGAGCYISSECVIGDDCILHPRVVLDNRVVMGCGCEIKSGAVLGQEGFGFERDENGIPTHFPHFGDVVMGNRVFIGSNTTVERATLGSTVIEDDVKIDDLVQIGHNSRIGTRSMIAVGAIVCGGVVLEAGSYLAPNVCVKEKVTIGSGGFAGLGAVVLRDVEPQSVVVGNPAKPLVKKSK